MFVTKRDGSQEELDIKKIQKVTKEDIVKIANSITINTIYFLKNIETTKEGQ